ncbi:MAG: TRL-like family protein [Candidatus Margulisbacteria bacterium]|nr:TRL-like family protein [Candidatus Margulisiibacteriota bacterium]
MKKLITILIITSILLTGINNQASAFTDPVFFLFVGASGLIVKTLYGLNRIDNYPTMVTNVSQPALATNMPGKKADLKVAKGSYVKILNIFSFYPGMEYVIPIWFFNFGDASINTISQEANIKQIHHVDKSTSGVWLFIKWFEINTVTVYGK